MKAAAEEAPGRFHRVSAGWKAASGVVATVGTAVGILATLGVIGGGEPVTPSDAIAGATKNVNASSFRLRVSMTEIPSSGASRASTIVGDGQLDYGASRGHMQYDLSQSTGIRELSKVDLVFDGPTLYLHDSGGLNLEKPWGRVEIADWQRLEGSSNATLEFFSDLGIDDPTQAVKDLEKSSSGARKIGDEAIFGDEWTHYRAEPDPDGRGPMRPETVDVWVDDAGYLRRIEKISQGPAATTRTRTELDEYGVKVRAKPPPSSQVVDLAKAFG
ncbi:MAG TPA: hypothetical protein VF715_13905 [Thermoleophilaceae bacterium]